MVGLLLRLTCQTSISDIFFTATMSFLPKARIDVIECEKGEGKLNRAGVTSRETLRSAAPIYHMNNRAQRHPAAVPRYPGIRRVRPCMFR